MVEGATAQMALLTWRRVDELAVSAWPDDQRASAFQCTREPSQRVGHTPSALRQPSTTLHNPLNPGAGAGFRGKGRDGEEGGTSNRTRAHSRAAHVMPRVTVIEACNCNVGFSRIRKEKNVFDFILFLLFIPSKSLVIVGGQPPTNRGAGHLTFMLCP